jgi:uncharacterized protein (TIGR03437 family)
MGANNSLGVALPNASITEDPAIRRTRGGTLGQFHIVLQLIPNEYPAVISTSTGSAIAHSKDGSMVSPAKPAAKGEILSLYATGLGPMVGVPIGQAFPASPLANVTAPVTVTVNGAPAQVLSATGYPGSTNGYQVNFQRPSDAASGPATVVVSSAWIPGPPATINIQ